MSKRRFLLGMLLGLLFVGIFALPAAAEPIKPMDARDWVPFGTVPPELLNGIDPAGRDLGREARDVVIKSLGGRSYEWLGSEQLTPVYFQDPDGYGVLTVVRVGVIFSGSDAEIKARVARGLFDQLYFVRAKAPYRNGVWEKGRVELLEQPALAVPALPTGGPAVPGEAVRGWTVNYTEGVPQPPIGSGLSLSDLATLPPLVEQLAFYPAEVIMGSDPADTSLVVSTQFQAQAAVVAGQDMVTVLMVRTVNAYKRAPWMDTLWKSHLADATDRLDDAAKAAGVAPERVATQRLLLRRGPTGWQVSEAAAYPQAYVLSVEPPTVADRVIGGMETLELKVPPQLLRAEPLDPVPDMVVNVGVAVVLAAWAGAAALGVSSRSMQILRQMGTETTGSRLARVISDAFDWLLSPLEKPLTRLMEKVGLARYFRDDEPAEPPDAVRAPAGERGYACSVCGSPVAEDWGYCTGCGAHLAADAAAEVAAAAAEPEEAAAAEPEAAAAPADPGQPAPVPGEGGEQKP